ncbi:MAG: hypothetical protein R3236_06205 [Phycisphaeraceae bacterium]|nr:hypothetical protein [Phycisphaeraceae bacterium]
MSTAPSASVEKESSGGASMWDKISDFFKSFGGGGEGQRGPSGSESAESGPDGKAKKLPELKGNAKPAAWKKLKPIKKRGTGEACPTSKNLGVVLFVHDVESKRRDFAKRCNADRWQAVHTVTDLIEGLRSLVGDCDCVQGIMISSHGGWSGHGGFRIGDDNDGDGKIESGEARDFVSTKAEAKKFGELIKEAFCEDGFISIESCSSSGPSNKFIKELNKATGLTTIGSPGTANLGGSDKKGAWWKAKSGRSQVNKDGTVKTDPAKKGTGVWKPF